PSLAAVVRRILKYRFPGGAAVARQPNTQRSPGAGIAPADRLRAADRPYRAAERRDHYRRRSGVEENRDVVPIRIRCREIELAVAVEVAGDQRRRCAPDRERRAESGREKGGKAAVAVSDKYRHVVVCGVSDREIELAVAVPIGGGDR